MAVSLYTTSGIFLDVVDSDWVNDILPFEDIQVNTDALPASEPELGAQGELNKQDPREKETRVECDPLSLLLPKNPIEASLSPRFLLSEFKVLHPCLITKSSPLSTLNLKAIPIIFSNFASGPKSFPPRKSYRVFHRAWSFPWLLHRKMGEVFAIINFAVALHRTVVDLSDPALQRRDDKLWMENIESGNKLAVLAGDILLAKASVELASFRIPKIVEIISGAIAESVCAEFTDFATGSAQIFSPSSQWLKYVKLRNGALLGECCAAATILSSSSVKDSESLLQSARAFGATWASLSRLLSELDFVREINIDAPVRPKSLTAIGFTERGLPEPTLADALWMASKNTSSICDQYKSIASTLAGQLRDSFDRLLDFTASKSDVHSLAKNSIDLLVKETL
ncbi:hypothetical protein Aperf_G00000087282 [Anoplocephala perfoliata]